MSSHREAPEISKDPSADNTDVYAFVSPDAPDTVTLIANFIPFQLAYGGPNFNEFADDVRYEIKISNAGDARADICFRFEFSTTIRNPDTFLYNTGPITSPTDPNWNRPQTYRLTRHTRHPHGGHTTRILGERLTCAPVNVGPRSTPHYPALAAATYHDLGHRRKVFAGQRADAFHVDLGSIFDLGALRPFNSAYEVPPLLPNMPGVNGLRGLNVHTIALQLPISDLTRSGRVPTDVLSPDAVIGVWSTASRASTRVLDRRHGETRNLGRPVQVSRLGNPLVNEVLNPMAEKDLWNALEPHQDARFAKYVLHPELAELISGALYPGAFPNLAAYVRSGKPRADLAAILLTGIPQGVVPGFQNYTGPVQADLLRLNVAVPPTPAARVNPIGLVAGDPAGFPNGRRIVDDVTAIELRAVAGATLPLVDPGYTPDGAAALLTDGTANDNTPYGAPLLDSVPYLSNPNSGYTTTPGRPGGEP
jgi:hypothetical protein